MRKPFFCIYAKTKTQINREADQRLCFRYLDSTIPLLLRSLAIFSDCAARFVSDQVRNPSDRFSHNEAKMIKMFVQQFRNVCKFYMYEVMAGS